MRLRVAPPASDAGSPARGAAGCAGCTRRAVLGGLVATAATALIGCPSGDPAPDAGPGSVASACGDDLCLDLNDPRNSALTEVDGALLVRVPGDIVLLVRTSMTAVQAVSDICTHAGCGVRYDRVAKLVLCPCHGSKFSLTGGVLQGPALRPLAKYQTELDLTLNRLTISL
jgi:nitrite reductase/ring-hydroxylating ferredoxin subunit